MSFLHKLHTIAHSVGERVLPPLQVSAFLEKGVLTPEEFVLAGDQLTRTCPTWAWAAGDPGKRRSYLPDNKQFLITRGVACEHRVRSLEENYSAEVELPNLDGLDDGDSWLATHNNTQSKDDEGGDEMLDLREMRDAVPVISANPVKTPVAAPVSAPQSSTTNAEDEDGFIDVDEFEEDGLADATGVVASSKQPTADKKCNDGAVLEMRTYDLSISYDNYYHTPRVWLYGYDEQQRPLSGEQVLEDIMQDYANKTVTIEEHPHLSGSVNYASIHPCRHADVMKKIVFHLTEGGKKAEPSQYLFIFLKFIQSVVPTMNYDTTIEVQASS